MAYEDVKNLSNEELDAQIKVFNDKVFAMQQQLDTDRRYLVQLQSERTSRTLTRNVDVVTKTYRYIDEILSGKVVIPDLDKVYLRENVNHRFENGEEKLCVHYIRAFSIIRARGKIRNYGERDEYFIPIDMPIDGNPGPEYEKLSEGVISIKYDYAYRGYDYDDIMVIFAFYFKREGDTRVAARKTEELMETVRANGYVAMLADEAENPYP